MARVRGSCRLRVAGCGFSVRAIYKSQRVIQQPPTRNRQPARQRGIVPATQHSCAAFSRPDGSAAKAAGFTLLEIVVVMTIIAAATVLGAMATTGGFERMRVHSSTAQIAANLRYTRAQAISTGRPQRFVIEPQAHAWQAPNGRHGRIPASLGVHFFGAREVQPSAGSGAIVFFDDGASTGGRVQVAGKHSAWNVDVAWLTGEVSQHRTEAEPQ